MIASLRRRHVMTMGTLAVAIPVVMAVALAGRIDWPAEGLPNALAADALAGDKGGGTSVFFDDLPITAITSRSDNGMLSVTFEPLPNLAEADLLVYWNRLEVAVVDDDSLLLGALPIHGGRLSFGVEGQGISGTLLLYSLAKRTVRARLTLPVENGR